MGKKNKTEFDAASLNKEQYIRDHYLVKEDKKADTIPKGKRIVIISMLSFLLISSAFLVYWQFYLRPDRTVESVNLEATPTIEITPAPTNIGRKNIDGVPTPRPVLSKYDEYKDIYPDIVGWISIDNIKVDYPVVQNSEPSVMHKYIDLGPDQKPNEKGAIFLDIRNSIDASDRHSIIYGHNMADGSMFGQIDKYLKRNFFFDHLIIRYDTLYEELEWEVFNVFITNTEFYYIQTYFQSDEEFVNLMTQCVYKSVYNDNETVISPEDRILTLSTCTNKVDDGRLVLQARLITPLESEEKTVEEQLSSESNE